jgi:Skp family chaperone for outer membrane proteins
MPYMRFAAVAAVLLCWPAPRARAQTPPQRLANVNMALILQNTPGRAQAESTFQQEIQGMQQQASVLQARLDSAASEFTRSSLVLSPAAKERRQQELIRMRDRTQQQVQELQTRASQRQQVLMSPIAQRVQAVIEGIRAENNYAMIFDASAQNGVLVTADRSLDVTPLVLQRLQSGVAQQTPAVRPSANPPLPGQAPADTSRPAPPRPTP